MKLQLIDKKIETEEVTSFFWQPEQPLEWQAGQSLHYILEHQNPDDRGVERWFTISSAPFEKTIQLTTRIVPQSSSFKKALDQLEIGATIEAPDAPDGKFILEDLDQEYIFLAGGIGITPFHSILKELDHQGAQPKITLLYGNRDQNIVFKKELAAFQTRNPHLQVIDLIAPDKIDEVQIPKNVSNLAKPIFYVSGPHGMVDSLDEVLKSMEIPDERIKNDWFPGYPAD